MKLTLGLNLIGVQNIEKNLSKKIILANTYNKQVSENVLKNSFAQSNDPIYFPGMSNSIFNPDIRYKNSYAYSPLTGINYRNNLFVFSRNKEIDRVIKVMTNEIVITQSQDTKYPVYPKIDMTQIDEDKQKTAEAIQEYLDKVFYPKLYQFYNFKGSGLNKKIKEFLITGKLAWEIIYDNPRKPKDIIGFLPIDPAELQKYKKDDKIYYVQRPLNGNTNIRYLHENQIILVEYNEYDFNWISYIDGLRRSFNIMRSMQTSKVMWFAAKSQVRIHYSWALGDVDRNIGKQRLSQSMAEVSNSYSFSDDTGEIKYNESPSTVGYREYHTAETTAGGKTEIEEVIGNGPDLTEVDSLMFFQKEFYKDTGIPLDRVDPNSSETWGFTDVNQLRKTEIAFSKEIAEYREILNEIFIKPIIIQLTLKEVEIGIDLTLLDAVKIEWVAFNEYEKLASMELLNKQIELCQNFTSFGEIEDINGKTRKLFSINFLLEKYLGFTKEQIEQLELYNKKQDIQLGFLDEKGNAIKIVDEEDDFEY